MIRIIDNFIPVEWQDRIHSLMGDEEADFPWYLNNYTIKTSDPQHQLFTEKHPKVFNSSKIFEQSQFTHMFVEGNIVHHYYNDISILCNALAETYHSNIDIIRIKGNLNTSADIQYKDYCYTPHTDILEHDNTYTAVYYVCDSNCGTMIFDDTFVKAKKGRCVIFPSHMIHAGTPPTEGNIKILINLNFKVAL